MGKSTFFKLLTGHLAQDRPAAGGRFGQHIGTARVEDARLDAVATLFKPKRITPAQIEFVDLAGIVKGEAKDSTYLAHLRNVDALAHVVRAFRDPTVLHVAGDIDPLRDLEVFELELIMADLALLENRRERVSKDLMKLRSADLEREAATLEALCPWLESGKPLREYTFSTEEERAVRGFTLLSQKPILLIINMDEADIQRFDEKIGEFGLDPLKVRTKTAVLPICAKLEAEIAELAPEEAAEFYGDLGYSEPGLTRVVKEMFTLLDLVSFITAGDPEVRAWPIPRGTTALKAAGAVHTDFEKGFIRAEVLDWKSLVACRSLAAARDRGALRLEGKEYVVQDGDVILFRFNV